MSPGLRRASPASEDRPDFTSVLAPQWVVDDLQRLACRRMPNEAGGLLYGGADSASVGRIDGFRELRGVDPSPSRYRADPRAVRDQVFRSDREFGRVIGMFHTHTRGAASPSALDSRASAAGYLHAIATVEPSPPRFRVFRRRGPADPLREIPLSFQPRDVRREPLRGYATPS